MGKRWARLCALAGSLIVIIGIVVGSGLAASAASAKTAAASATTSVKPNATSMMDCNGHSPVYKSVNQDLGGRCVDPRGTWGGRFEDNGTYVGHDEPSVKFISSAPGSGNDMTFVNKPGWTPRASRPFRRTAKTGQRLCGAEPRALVRPADLRPRVLPAEPLQAGQRLQQRRYQRSQRRRLGVHGASVLPAGLPALPDATSCDSTHWCAALTIDSLESQFNFVNLNTACEEPVNFAFLQRNGVPAGPPSPQLTDVSTFRPNHETLMMNPGDTVATTIRDTPQGLLASVTDFTTHQTGYIVASGKNGFMNTNYKTCAGTPFNFHPEYNTAKQQNQVPWAALEGGVLMQQEIGHFETCSSITNSLPYRPTRAARPSATRTRRRPASAATEGKGKVGEGPCNASTGVCQNATTQGGVACPSDNFTSGALCEYSDMTCVPAGPRPVNVNGTAVKLSWPIAGCQDNFFQNGDLDFDGSSYIRDWPDGSPNHPDLVRLYRTVLAREELSEDPVRDGCRRV